MDIKPIKSEADYKNALREIEGLMMAAPDSPEGDKLDVLTTIVEAYEAKHYPMEMPNPIEAIKFRMEQSNLRPVDVAPWFGKVNRYYEVMGGKRSLSLSMIRTISEKLKIPADVLIQPTLERNSKPTRATRVRSHDAGERPKPKKSAPRRYQVGHA